MRVGAAHGHAAVDVVGVDSPVPRTDQSRREFRPGRQREFGRHGEPGEGHLSQRTDGGRVQLIAELERVHPEHRIPAHGRDRWLGTASCEPNSADADAVTLGQPQLFQTPGVCRRFRARVFLRKVSDVHLVVVGGGLLRRRR